MAAPTATLEGRPRVEKLSVIRLGDIQFLNSWPVTYALRMGRAGGGAAVTSGTPTEISRRLLSGELDASAVSSLLYLKHEEELAAVPGFCIRAEGAVGSVLVISRKPLESLRWKKIGVTNTGATTPVLLKILMARRGFKMEGEVTSLRYPEILEEYPAALLIGDEALAASRQARNVFLWDLSASWTQWTGLPMVFALWAVRRRLVEQDPDLPGRIQGLLAQSHAWGKAHPKALIAAMQEVFPWPAAFFKQYLGRLSYTLDPKAWAGIRRLAREASNIGELT